MLLDFGDVNWFGLQSEDAFLSEPDPAIGGLGVGAARRQADVAAQAAHAAGHLRHRGVVVAVLLGVIAGETLGVGYSLLSRALQRLSG